MAELHLAFNSPTTPVPGHDRPISGSLQTDQTKLLSALSGLSGQIADLKSSITEPTTLVNDRFNSMEDRLTVLERNSEENTNPRKRR